MSRTELPLLYGTGSTGKTKLLRIFVDDLGKKGALITMEHGLEGCKQAVNHREITEGKNLGKSNQSTPLEQALADAHSKWQKKKDQGYTETKKAQKTLFLPLPMLALKYTERKHDIKFPCYVQPKLDGCLYGTTRIETSEGFKTIKDIVENKLTLDIKTYNIEKNIIEWKPIVNWMNNGKANYQEWMDVVPKFGKPLKVTNHQIFTNNGWKTEQTISSETDTILSTSYETRLNNLIAGTILGDSSLVIEKRGKGTSYRLIFQHTNKEYFDFKVRIFNIPGQITDIITGYGSKGWRFTSHTLTTSTFPVKLFYNVGHNKLCGQRKLVTYRNLRNLLTLESIALWIGDDGSLAFNNKDKTTPVLMLHTQGFPKQQVIELQKYFKRKLNCNPSIIATKKKDKRLVGYFLNFNTKDTLYLLNKLRNTQCSGVEYKFYFENKNYITPITKKEKFISFKKRHAKNMRPAVKYDIEVKDNHNFFANGILVHNCRMITDANTYFSRGGKEFTVLDHLNEEVSILYEATKCMLDGEIYNHHEISFQDICAAVKKLNPQTPLLKYYIYDLAVEGIEFVKRTERISAAFDAHKFKHLVCVPTYECTEESQIFLYHDRFVQEGYEGAIIRNRDGLYTFKHRSKDLQKLKKFDDAEFKIIGGKQATGDDAGTVVFLCETKSGAPFECRPRGSREQRREWFKNLKSLINKKLTVRFQGVSDDGIPRFPVGVSVRDFE